MSAEEVDNYLGELDEPKRGTLEALRQTISAIIPEAEQGLSYAVPVFRLTASRWPGSPRSMIATRLAEIAKRGR